MFFPFVFCGKNFFPVDFKYLALICGFCGILDNGQWMITPKAGMCMNSCLMFIRNERWFVFGEITPSLLALSMTIKKSTREHQVLYKDKVIVRNENW